MDKNYIYEYIVKLGGDCFVGDQRPPCGACPFQDKCLKKILTLAESIPKETRLNWALDKLVEDLVLNDDK